MAKNWVERGLPKEPVKDVKKTLWEWEKLNISINEQTFLKQTVEGEPMYI